MFKFWKKISIASAVTLAAVIIPNITFADLGLSDLTGGFFSAATSALQWFTEMAGYVIAYVTSQLIAMAAYFIQLMIQMSIHIMESPIVKQGFTITLSFANLGFVLAIIFISFITIFRLQGYETKKLLRNLIVAAVLINFSFTFAGLIMDASHIFSNFFINAIAGDTHNLENLTLSIGNSLNINKLHTTPPSADALQAAANAGDAYISTLASISLNIFYNSMIVITFFTLAGMMVIRYVAISILLIVMPFAWLCWIFPGLSKYWGIWWDEFKKWNIFLPVLMFFIYLSLVTSSSIGSLVTTATSGLTSATAASGYSGSPISLIIAIAQGIIQVGLLFGGLMIAQKMGIAGSVAISNATNFMKNKIQGTATALTGVPLAYRGVKALPGAVAGAAGAVIRAGGGAGPSSKFYSQLGNLLNKTSLTRGMAARMYSAAEAPKAAAKKAVADGVKAAKDAYIGDEAQQAHILSPARSDQSRAEKVMLAAETGKLDFMKKELGDEKFGAYMKAASNMGLAKDIASKRPDLASKELFGDEQKAKEFIEKLGKDDWKNVDSSSFTDIKLWNKLDDEQREQVLKNRKHSQVVIKAMADQIEGAELDLLDAFENENLQTLLESPAIRKKIQQMEFPAGKGINLKKMASTAEALSKESKAPKKNKVPTEPQETQTNRPTFQKPAISGLATGQQQKVFRAPETPDTEERIQMKRRSPQRPPENPTT